VRAARAIGLELDHAAVKQAYCVVDFRNRYSSVQVTNRDGFYHNYNEQLCEALGVSSYFQKLQPALAALFLKAKRWVLMEDAQRTLASLNQRGIPLGLVANWDSNLPSLTEELGIRKFFSVIVPSQAVGVEKPDKEIFRCAAEKLSLSLSADRILYVGNEYRADVLGAREAGLTPVLIDRNRLYQHADCLRFNSLIEWLQAME
jgi:putative hydrolase of the HAD superfamily